MARRVPRALACAVVALALGRAAAAATITVVNRDGPGEGLNDPTVVAPVGGNPGTTRGAQRLYALQYAANAWGDQLDSAVGIAVDARFDTLDCAGTSAVLGSASANSAHRDFVGAPLAHTWYPAPLANKLAGLDLAPGSEMHATFNDAIDAGCVPGRTFYYGLDGNNGNDVDFVTIALHELAHGLGFATYFNLGSGARLMGFDDAFERNLESHAAAKLFPAMTDAERASAVLQTGDLHWTGAAVVAGSGLLTAGRHPSGHVEMYAPVPLKVGSSVNHFSNTLTPNELMEPSYSGATHTLGLTLALLRDVGWGCGDGIISLGEECDDGNQVTGDGCDATCHVEACHSCSGVPSLCSPVDDGVACEDGDADPCSGVCHAGSCVNGPNSGPPCDDGDQNPCTSGRCSAGTCAAVATSGASCDDQDGDPCTNGVCAAGECVGTNHPRSDCSLPAVSHKSSLTIKHAPTGVKDVLSWKWSKGTDTDVAAFGNPLVSTDVTLCIYERTGPGQTPALALRLAAPAGGTCTGSPCWRTRSDGFTYVDHDFTPDGIKSITLKAGTNATAKIVVKGIGPNTRVDTALPLDPRVSAQLIAGSSCWEARYSTPKISDGSEFKAKAE